MLPEAPDVEKRELSPTLRSCPCGVGQRAKIFDSSRQLEFTHTHGRQNLMLTNQPPQVSELSSLPPDNVTSNHVLAYRNRGMENIPDCRTDHIYPLHENRSLL